MPDAGWTAERRLWRRPIFLIERFDRSFDRIVDAMRPGRSLYASAHTVLNLPPAATRGEPARSYLAFADAMRIWCRNHPHLDDMLVELWRRMAFNALVGNIDDHPRNHALRHDGQVWGLSPAFDITPALRQPPQAGDGVVLAMATGVDGHSIATPDRLVAAAPHFGLSCEAAGAWLEASALRIAAQWESRLRAALAPCAPLAAEALSVVASSRQSIVLAVSLADDPGQIGAAVEAGLRSSARRRYRLG